MMVLVTQLSVEQKSTPALAYLSQKGFKIFHHDVNVNVNVNVRL
jgi:hypothetical protein